jgi:hypothetical protein
MADPNNVVDSPHPTPRTIIGWQDTPAADQPLASAPSLGLLIFLGVIWAIVGSAGLYLWVECLWDSAPGIAGVGSVPASNGVEMVGLLGAVGGYIRCLHTFTRCFSQKQSLLEWAISTLLTPLKSCLLALVTSLLILAGLINLNKAGADANWIGIYAVSGLVGLFANEAVSKLEEVFKTLFGTTQKPQPNNHQTAANGTDPHTPA